METAPEGLQWLLPGRAYVDRDLGLQPVPLGFLNLDPSVGA